jgi:hypothetical protein
MIKPDRSLTLCDFSSVWEMPESGKVSPGTVTYGYTPLNFAPERGYDVGWSYNSEVWMLACWFSMMSYPDRHTVY